jgi:hypothetical protein
VSSRGWIRSTEAAAFELAAGGDVGRRLQTGKQPANAVRGGERRRRGSIAGGGGGWRENPIPPGRCVRDAGGGCETQEDNVLFFALASLGWKFVVIRGPNERAYSCTDSIPLKKLPRIGP